MCHTSLHPGKFFTGLHFGGVKIDNISLKIKIFVDVEFEI